MSEFRVPQNNDPLDTLFKLQALKQSQEQRAIDEKHDLLRTSLEVLRAGGDPTSLLERLNDPALGSALGGAYETRKQERDAGLFAAGTSPEAVAPFVRAAAPIADQSGQIVAPSPEAQRVTRDQFAAVLRARGVPEARIPDALGIFDAGTTAAGRASTEQVAGERRQFAQQDALSARSAGRAEAAQKRAEDRMLRAEERARTTNDAEEFTVNAANIVLADPARQPELIKDATDRFGVDAARRFEYRLANLTEAGGAKVALDKKARQIKVNEALDQGRTADPYIARLAADGKAGYDPTTQFYYGSQDTQAEKQLSGLASIYEIHSQYLEAAQLFAENSGGKVLTGNLEDLSRKVGAGNPYFTSMRILGERYRTNLAFLKSGANVPAEEYQRLLDASPDTAQLNIKDNRLTPAAAVSFAANREELESMYLARFSRADRAAVRNSLRTFGEESVAGVRDDPTSWLNSQAAPTSNGARVLQSVREAAGQPQPGAR